MYFFYSLNEKDKGTQFRQLIQRQQATRGAVAIALSRRSCLLKVVSLVLRSDG